MAIAVFAWIGMWFFPLALGALAGGRYVAAVALARSVAREDLRSPA